MSRSCSFGSLNSAGSATPGSTKDLYNDSVTTLFLLSVLADLARKVQRRKQSVSHRAVALFLAVVKYGARGRENNDWCPFRLAFRDHLSEYADGYVSMAGILTCPQAQVTFDDLGIQYPSHMEDGVNNPSYSIDCMHLLTVLLRCGKLPFQVLCAFAALTDDGLQRCTSVFVYRQVKRCDEAKRHNVTKLDKYLAFENFLANTTKGIKGTTCIPVLEEDVPLVGESQTSSDAGAPGADDDEDYVGDGAICSVEEKAKKRSIFYRNVITEGSMLL